MNIAILIPAMVIGGAERAAQMIGDYYAEKGNKLYYFVFYRSCGATFPVNGKVIEIDVPQYRTYNKNNALIDFLDLSICAIKVRRLKRRYGIDATISFMEWCNPINILSRVQDRVIVSVRTTLSARTEYTGLIYDVRWIKFMYNRADLVVAVSNYTKRDLSENYGILPSKLLTIPNPAIRQRNNERKDSWSYGEKVIICVGRLDPVKQQDRLIRAFSYVKEKENEAKLLIIGDGPIRKYLEKICKDFGVEDSVIFVKFTDQIGYYLENARVFVMTSKAEGFPNAMVEAMAYGVPVVTTDSPGGCGEIIGKEVSNDAIQYCKYGLLTPYMNGRAPKSRTLERNEILLGEAICDVLENNDLYKKYSHLSVQRAEYYRKDRIMGIWDKVLGIYG